jgi:hypothetical protein
VSTVFCFHFNVSFRFITPDILVITMLSAILRWGQRGGPVGSRHYATKRKVAGSIPDGVIGIFH